ncbi:hypothetical protein OEA41_003252 [Lepraria neglecta]|uniref:Uncharacterized protein n=1 Tax=Lepraria neglecta TaxID=209136 RepID=A0AAD9Z5N4_9LECA|nr:hypothetical protein OEA41_003252 [Lepraria neglecta]
MTSSFGTKKSALVTLRKIGKSTVLNGACDEFGSEVLNTLHHGEPSLDKAMSETVDEDEKAKMRSDREWVEKVRELIGLGKDHDMYETLDAMLRKIGVGRGQGKVQEPKYEGLDGTVTTKNRQTRYKNQKSLVGICVEAVGAETPRCSSCWGDEEDGFLD